MRSCTSSDDRSLRSRHAATSCDRAITPIFYMDGFDLRGVAIVLHYNHVMLMVPVAIVAESYPSQPSIQKMSRCNDCGV